MVALNQNRISPLPSHHSAPILRQTPPQYNSTSPTLLGIDPLGQKSCFKQFFVSWADSEITFTSAGGAAAPFVQAAIQGQIDKMFPQRWRGYELGCDREFNIFEPDKVLEKCCPLLIMTATTRERVKLGVVIRRMGTAPNPVLGLGRGESFIARGEIFLWQLNQFEFGVCVEEDCDCDPPKIIQLPLVDKISERAPIILEVSGLPGDLYET